ncbi:MAG: hypothetical protein QXG00_03230 [Candidatus Woesearchaeota archaeon]
MKKSQVALEFLVTYGWALMIILIMIGVIVYFGLMNPNNFISDNCDMGDELKCEDFGIYNNGVIIQVRNNFGKDIVVSNIEFTLGDKEVPLIPIAPCSLGVIPNGRIYPIRCEFNQNDILSDREKKKLNIIITYNRAPMGNPHTISGTLIGTLQNNNVPLLTCALYGGRCCINYDDCTVPNGEPAADINYGDFNYGPVSDCNDGWHTCWSKCSRVC